MGGGSRGRSRRRPGRAARRLLLAGALGLAGPVHGGDRPGEAPAQEGFGAQDVEILTARIVESLLVSSLVSPDSPRTVAWMQVRNRTEEKGVDKRAMMASLETALIKSRAFRVLSRTNLEAIADENALSMTALDGNDEDTSDKLAKLAGVEYWLSATLHGDRHRGEGNEECTVYFLTASATVAATGEKVWAEAPQIKKCRDLQLMERTRLKRRKN